MKMNLPSNMVLKAIKPLYGIPQSGLYWYLTYLDYHVETPNMVQSRVDPCLLFQLNENLLPVLVIMQVDDSVIVGTEWFLLTEDEMNKVFLSKPRKHLEKKRTTLNFVELSVMSDRVTNE